MERSDQYYHGSPQLLNEDFSRHTSQNTYASEEIYQDKSEFEPSNEARPYGGKSSGVYQKKSDSRCQLPANRVSSIKNLQYAFHDETVYQFKKYGYDAQCNVFSHRYNDLHNYIFKEPIKINQERIWSNIVTNAFQSLT